MKPSLLLIGCYILFVSAHSSILLIGAGIAPLYLQFVHRLDRRNKALLSFLRLEEVGASLLFSVFIILQ